jgi:hypothetical protein
MVRGPWHVMPRQFRQRTRPLRPPTSEESTGRAVMNGRPHPSFDVQLIPGRTVKKMPRPVSNDTMTSSYLRSLTLHSVIVTFLSRPCPTCSLSIGVNNLYRKVARVIAKTPGSCSAGSQSPAYTTHWVLQPLLCERGNPVRAHLVRRSRLQVRKPTLAQRLCRLLDAS